MQVNHNRFLGYTKDESGKLVIVPGEAMIDRRVYSPRYALSCIVFCGHCGDIYRRIKWNNRGCKSTVWRCVNRVLKKSSEIDCPARAIHEEDLQNAVVTAVNDAWPEGIW